MDSERSTMSDDPTKATSVQEREKLAERIAKLLRLASNNPSEREAVAAMERAYALMEAHNLTMAQVDAHGSGDERVQETAHGDYRRQTWARRIWAGVAGLNFCMHAYVPAEVDEHLIVGTQSNVASTKVMAEYLIATVERLARERREEECLYGARQQHAYKLGCADRLRDRLITLRREREQASRKEQQAASGNLPVLADVYTAHKAANEELYRSIHGCMPSGGSALGSSDSDAYGRGHAAGGGISLAAQVSGKGTRALPRR